jgi:hypothetical protein
MGLYGDADLVMTRDVTYTRTLQYLVQVGTVATPIDWSLYTVTSQVRDRFGNVVFDLTPYFAPLSSDHTKLVLSVPKAVVQTITHDTKWDLVATLISDPTQAFRTPVPPGRVLVLAGVTDA